ncbi:MAG: hypothetical protein KatS3mg129_0394 [Leptospiraceae bacterium]|nr:MAG: hypothetical protein KatS3mg129_0394 [Leptospiraceae bacterium]
MFIRLKKKLEEWLNHNIIDEKTYNSILRYEEELKLSKKNYFLISLYSIAGFSIGIGILSIIAANWEYIPSITKFSVLLLFHLGLGILYIWVDKNKTDKIYIKEILLVLFAFLFLGEIALTSQVFQLKGELEDALLFWGILMLFVSLLAETVFLPLINFIILHIAIWFKIDEFDYFTYYFKYYFDDGSFCSFSSFCNFIYSLSFDS